VILGVQLLGMGLIGEYLGRVYADVRARPRYFVDRVVGRSWQAAAGPSTAGSHPEPAERNAAGQQARCS